MIVRNSLEDLPIVNRAFVTIGNFDGLHIGHQRIFSTLRRDAGNEIKIALTFKKAPLEFLNPDHFNGYLFPDGLKERFIEKEGMDEIVLLDFPEIAGLSAMEFLAILKSRVKDLHLYVGYNFRFGHGNTGNSEMLSRESKISGFHLTVVDRVFCKLETVSSSLIRKKLTDGQADKASELLGRPYCYASLHIDGDRIGRTIGFPTINLSVNRQVIPEEGVYFTYLVHKQDLLPSMTYIGKRPTVNGIETRIETNVLPDLELKEDFNPGETRQLLFISKIRNEKKFHNLDDLQKNLYNDKSIISGLSERYPLSLKEEWKKQFLE